MLQSRSALALSYLSALAPTRIVFLDDDDDPRPARAPPPFVDHAPHASAGKFWNALNGGATILCCVLIFLVTSTEGEGEADGSVEGAIEDGKDIGGSGAPLRKAKKKASKACKDPISAVAISAVGSAAADLKSGKADPGSHGSEVPGAATGDGDEAAGAKEEEGTAVVAEEDGEGAVAADADGADEGEARADGAGDASEGGEGTGLWKYWAQR